MSTTDLTASPEGETESTSDQVDRWCNMFTVGNYPLCKSIALALLRRPDLASTSDASIFARKAMAQSLHFLGAHAAAADLAAAVRRDATGPISCSAVEPRVSMGIILARVAALTLRMDEARDLAAEALARAETRNAASLCQVLALATIPAAVWRGDLNAALAAARHLRRTAELNRMSYWSGWAQNADAAVRVVAGDDDEAAAAIDFDRLDAKQADHLAALDGRLISDLAARRAQTGLVGWTRPEVLRARAAATGWFDRDGARDLVAAARAQADASGATLWLARLAATEAELGLAARAPDAIPHPTARRRASG